jgi:hypothetical protein
MQRNSNVANFVNNFEFFSIYAEFKGLLLTLILNQTSSACNPLVFYKFKVRILKTDQLMLWFNFKNYFANSGWLNHKMSKIDYCLFREP